MSDTLAQAAIKGVDSFTTGSIMGIYELVVLISSPFFGIYVSNYIKHRLL